MKRMKIVKPDGLLQLGDFAHPHEKHQKLADLFNRGAKHTIHAIGNHDLDHGHTKEQCVKSWGMPGRYYTKDIEGLRLIVLDGNDKGSPTYSKHGGYHSYVAPEQQKWLQKQLEESDMPIMVVSHQPLAGRIEIDNAKEIRKIISAQSDKVILCMNGHSHVDQQLSIDGVTYLHINSASYYWLGGKVRTAKYKDPLYAEMIIDPKKKEIRIKGISSDWLMGTPDDVGYFKGDNAKLKENVVPKIRDRKLG